MKMYCLALLFVLNTFLTVPVQAVTTQDLIDMPAKSWLSVPNTHMRDVAPPNKFNGYWYDFYSHNAAVITAWNSGIYDSKRNRLIIWGGGHNDYNGNELYAFDIKAMKWERLTDPSPPNEYMGSCIDPLSDGNPNQRHTYDGLQYLTHADRFWANGGSLSCGSGGGGRLTWTFNFDNKTWTNMQPNGTAPSYHLMKTSAYDPISKLVYMHDTHYLYSYNYDSNTWTKLSGYFYSYEMTSTVDTKRGLMLLIGKGNQFYYDIGQKDYVRKSLSTSGDNGFISKPAPGARYDPVSDCLVCFAGGIVYSLDMNTKVWTKNDLSGKPTGGDKGFARNVAGHWQYVPDYNVFVLVTSVNNDVYFYKHTAGGGTTGVEVPIQDRINISVKPNPFKLVTKINYELGIRNYESQKFQVKIYDTRGGLVEDLSNQIPNSSFLIRNSFSWNAAKHPAGLYIARITVGKKILTRNLFLVK